MLNVCDTLFQRKKLRLLSFTEENYFHGDLMTCSINDINILLLVAHVHII